MVYLNKKCYFCKYKKIVYGFFYKKNKIIRHIKH